MRSGGLEGGFVRHHGVVHVDTEQMGRADGLPRVITSTDALNRRLHHDTIDTDAPTVTGSRGHRIAVGDLIISRRNDTTIELRNTNDPAAEQNPVRNGHRWRVSAISLDNNCLAARRLADNTQAVFDGDYVREQITHGYAVTVHSAQGVTADTTHAVLGENTTRSMLYVAMTRGRETNGAYIYETATEQEYGLNPLPGAHVMCRGTAQHAGRLARAIIANHVSRSPRGRCSNIQRRTAWTRAPHPRPPRSDGAAPAGNLLKLASRRAELRPGYDHRARAPQQPQPGPKSRLRDRDVAAPG
jgi:hypothetical protein